MALGEGGLRFAVVGMGRLGGALCAALPQAKKSLTALVSRRPETHALGRRFGVPVVSLQEASQLADVLLLTVPDDVLATVASELMVDESHLVVHCSGALPLQVLAPVLATGAAIAGFHPLQAFPVGAGSERFAGIWIGIEAANAHWRAVLEELAVALEAQPLALEGVDRARYHAAAVFASNYLVAALHAAEQTWAAAGLPVQSAVPALLPLARGALQAAAEQPLTHALTGPVARGDVATVERHLQVLQDDPLMQQTYALLGSQLLRLGRPVEPALRIRLRDALMRVLASLAATRSGQGGPSEGPGG